MEKSDEKLGEETSPADDGSNAKEDKVLAEKTEQNKRVSDNLGKQIESLTETITSSIDNISLEVKKMDDGGESASRVQALRTDLHNLDNKIDVVLNGLFSQYVCLLEEKEIPAKEATRALFTKNEKSKIANILLMLSKKTN